MKKVIAVLDDNHYCLTTAPTAIKNNWYIAYWVTVIKEERLRPDAKDEHKIPKIGTVMYGIGGHVYRISEIKPSDQCAYCMEPSSTNRVYKKFYCDQHYKELVVTHPIKTNGTVPGRNDKCRCGSGKKYKKCCMAKDRHTARHYFNSEYTRNKKTV